MDDRLDPIEPDRFVGSPDNRLVAIIAQDVFGQQRARGDVEMGRRVVEHQDALLRGSNAYVVTAGWEAWRSRRWGLVGGACIEVSVGRPPGRRPDG